jgi:hypothetical protein
MLKSNLDRLQRLIYMAVLTLFYIVYCIVGRVKVKYKNKEDSGSVRSVVFH